MLEINLEKNRERLKSLLYSMRTKVELKNNKTSSQIEVIQIITKMKRFGGSWDEKRPGKDLTRWQELETEMYDLLNCWQRLRNEVQPAILEVSHWDEDETDKH